MQEDSVNNLSCIVVFRVVISEDSQTDFLLIGYVLSFSSSYFSAFVVE